MINVKPIVLPRITSLAQLTKRYIIEDKTGVEGGYVNDPSDSGKETNHGCTIALCTDYAPQLKQLFGWSGRMIDLTVEMAFWLYDTHFWARMRGDQIVDVHPLLADKMFDVCINSGVTTGVRMLQEQLNLMNNGGTLYPDIVADGKMGAGTLGALTQYVKARGGEGIMRLIVMLVAAQGGNFKDVATRRPKDEKFYYGWSGRVARDFILYAELLQHGDTV